MSYSALLQKSSLLLVTMWWALPCFGEVSLKINVETTAIRSDEPLEFSVTVSGDRQAPQPQFPTSPDFDLEFSGTSSQVQIINGAMSSATEFSYSLQPKREGTMVLGPAQVEIGGKIYRSNQVTLQVGKAPDDRPEERHYFVTAEVSNVTPYRHEEVIYTFKFYHRAAIAEAQFKQPEFTGFTREELGKQRQYDETIAGQDWNVTAISFALFPTTTGQVTIEPATLNISVVVEGGGRKRRGGIGGFFDDSFFSSTRRKTVNLRTKPLALTVNPLPPQPAGEAKTLLVGNFSLTSSITPNHARVGDSATATVVVEGEGNIWDAQLEPLESGDIKVYADKPTLKTEVRNFHISGRKEFKFALVPQTPGPKTLPRFALRYFDPSKKSYQLLESEPASLVVGEADDQGKVNHVGGSDATKRAKHEIKVVASDLMPLKTDPRELNQQPLTTGETALFMALMGLCPLVYGGFLLRHRQQRRLAADSNLMRRKNAYRLFKQRHAQLQKEIEQPGFYERLAGMIRSYLGDKFAIVGLALTTADVTRKLGDKAIAPAVLTLLTSVLQRCEAGQYGGGGSATTGASSSNERRELLQQVYDIVTRLEGSHQG